MHQKLKQGFSLIELAIVLVVMAILFQSVGIPIYQQHKQQKIAVTQKQLESIGDLIVSYFATHKRLPCPAIINGSGLEAFQNNQCRNKNGFIPMQTLGLTGRVNEDGLLLDAWGQPIRYHVSSYDQWIWFDSARISQLSGLSTLKGDLTVCLSSDECRLTTGGLLMATELPFVLLSLGAIATVASADQQENANEQQVLGLNRRYGLNADEQFVARSEQLSPPNAVFDDILHWESKYRLHFELLRASGL